MVPSIAKGVRRLLSTVLRLRPCLSCFNVVLFVFCGPCLEPRKVRKARLLSGPFHWYCRLRSVPWCRESGLLQEGFRLLERLPVDLSQTQVFHSLGPKTPSIDDVFLYVRIEKQVAVRRHYRRNAENQACAPQSY